MFETGAVVLGYVGNVASWRRLNPALPGVRGGTDYLMLTIHSVSSTDDGAHTPAESVTVSGRDALLALRGAIDEALREGPSS
jgi:hypothetical protein